MHSQTDGDADAMFILRTCGHAFDQCLDHEYLEPYLDEYVDAINPEVENGTYLGFEGYVCFCTGDFCNVAGKAAEWHYTSMVLLLLVYIVAFELS